MGLFNSTIVEVTIGVIFVYLLLSILCTSANEWVAALTRRRGEMLRKGIRQLLENQSVQGRGGRDGFLQEFISTRSLPASSMTRTTQPMSVSNLLVEIQQEYINASH